MNFVVGRDHGKGKFRMVVIVLFRGAEVTRSQRYICGEIDCKKDSSEVLKRTFLKRQNDSTKKIVAGKRFAVAKNAVAGKLTLYYKRLPTADPQSRQVDLCDVPSRVLVCGDLAFYATILGRERMSGIWCWMCKLRKKEWSQQAPIDTDYWTIDERIAKHAEGLNAAARMGMQEEPLWDFIDPKHYLFPVLHAQIGLINDMLDFLNDWIDERIEVLADEELASRNARLMADVAHDEAEEEVERWKRLEGVLIHELKQSKQDLELQQGTYPMTAEQNGTLESLSTNIAFLEADLNDKLRLLVVMDRCGASRQGSKEKEEEDGDARTTIY